MPRSRLRDSARTGSTYRPWRTVTKRSAKTRSPSACSSRSRSATSRRRRSRSSRRTCPSRVLARSVRTPSSSRARRRRSRRSLRRGRLSALAASVGATGRIARPYAASRGAASSTGSRPTSSGPSRTLPSARARSRTGRGSDIPSSGGAPSCVSARRASAVLSRACSTSVGSVKGSAVKERSRPIVVRASEATRARTASHSIPRPQSRPASTLRLIRSRPGWTEVLAVPSGVLPLLIGHPLPPLRFLARGEGLPLAPNAGLLVVLSLLELRQEPGLLALLLEALQCALEGLIGLDDHLGHSAPPSAESQAWWINVNYIPCGPTPSNRRLSLHRDDERRARDLRRRSVRSDAAGDRRRPGLGAALVGIERQQAPRGRRGRRPGAHHVSRARAFRPAAHGGGLRLLHPPVVRLVCHRGWDPP